jgi:hypothetical protein
VSFEHPAALWGLGSLILLILFSLWRQASAQVIVPSLLLWKQIPERNPPVRALRRPRWRLELLLQALAISAAVGALARPYRETREPQPRRIALVFDTSARMRAGDRMAKMKARAGQLIQDQLSHDIVTCYEAAPSPRKIGSPTEAEVVDTHVNLGPLIQGAAAEADHVILFSDREADGATPVLFGTPADNAGIVEFSVSDDEAFVRIVNHGPARPLPIELWAGDLKVRETVPAGQRTWSHKADYSKAAFIRITLFTNDSFPLDDVVEATRLVSGGALVTLAGRHHDSLPKVFRAMPGVTVQRGGSGALVAVGWDEAPGPGELRVFIHSPTNTSPGEVVVAPHELMHDLEKRGRELVLGELPAAERAGEPLITVGGRVAAVLRKNELHLCVDLNQWQGMPSFPIFWVNVVDAAQKASRGLVVIRTGRPIQLTPNSLVDEVPAGAIRELTGEGMFVAFTVGAYRLRLAGGDKHIYVNLLDERESDTAGQTRDLAWDSAGPATRVFQRQDLTAWAAWSALGLLVLAWLLQVRPE